MNEDVRRLFEVQHGVLLRSQALKHGMTKRVIDGLLERKEWIRAYSGLYRLGGMPETWEQRVHAAMLWSSGAASHRTAARLWRLDLEVSDSAPIDVVTRKARRPSSEDGLVVHRSRRITPADLTERSGIRVTRLGTTLIHLTQVLDTDSLEGAVDSAIRNRPGLLTWLSKHLERGGANGLERGAVLQRLVAARQHGTFDSLLEVRAKQLLEKHWLAPTHVHYPIHEPFEMNLDFVWEPQRVALALMGMKDHGKRKRFELDMTQIRELAARQWTVLPATWNDVHFKAEPLVNDLVRALQASRVPLTNNVPAWIFEPRQLELGVVDFGHLRGG